MLMNWKGHIYLIALLLGTRRGDVGGREVVRDGASQG